MRFFAMLTRIYVQTFVPTSTKRAVLFWRMEVDFLKNLNVVNFFVAKLGVGELMTPP